MPFSMAGIAAVDHLQESGLKSIWEVWREYAYKTSLVVLSLFVFAPQVKFNCINSSKANGSELTTVQANAINSYCKTNFVPWHTRYSGIFAFGISIVLYIASNFWIHIPGNKERLHCMGKLASTLLEHHMDLDDMKKVAVKPLKSSSEKRSHAIRENVLILLEYGKARKLWKWYVGRCSILLVLLPLFCAFCAKLGDSFSIFQHGLDDIVTCRIPKSAIDLGSGEFNFTCIDEFTMIDSMLEFVFFCTMLFQGICVLFALLQLLSLTIKCNLCEKCCKKCKSCCSMCSNLCCPVSCPWSCCECCSCSPPHDVPHFVISMADFDGNQSSVITGFSEYVLHDVKDSSNGASGGGGNNTTKISKMSSGGEGNDITLLNGLLANQTEAKGDDVHGEIIRKLKSNDSTANQNTSPDHVNATDRKPEGVPTPTNGESSTNQDALAHAHASNGESRNAPTPFETARLTNQNVRDQTQYRIKFERIRNPSQVSNDRCDKYALLDDMQ